ncbi:hypothetical protein QBC46DRAFT_217185, partial [Diplogelasinospora grovesii]
PPCLICGTPSSFREVLPYNTNGNALRPYYRCEPCDKFVTFADLIGCHPDNPPCNCEPRMASREVVTGSNAQCGAGRKVWRCAEGRCRYWKLSP